MCLQTCCPRDARVTLGSCPYHHPRPYLACAGDLLSCFPQGSRSQGTATLRQHGGDEKQQLQQMDAALPSVWGPLPKLCQTHALVHGLMNEEKSENICQPKIKRNLRELELNGSGVRQRGETGEVLRNASSSSG